MSEQIPTPYQQHFLVNYTKLKLKFLKSSIKVLKLLEQERINTEIDLIYIRRGFIKQLYDKIFWGIPFWVPQGDFSIWLKEKRPKIYRTLCRR